jgi:hypothetical protein
MKTVANVVGLLIIGLIILGLAKRPQIVQTFFSGLSSNLSLLTK